MILVARQRKQNRMSHMFVHSLYSNDTTFIYLFQKSTETICRELLSTSKYGDQRSQRHKHSRSCMI